MIKQTNLKHNFLTILLVFVVSAFAFAQTPKAQKDLIDMESYEKFKKGQNIMKGVEAFNYTVMENLLENRNLQVVDFKVKVQSEQKVMVEIFDDMGELIEVVYNDFMPENKEHIFTLSKKNWLDKSNTHFLRVTTDEYIENHEIKF